MNPQAQRESDRDWLEQALRDDGRAYRSEYVADDGFSLRVLQALPRAVTAPAWRKPILALMWTGAAIAALLAIPGLFDDVFRGAVAMFVGHRLGIGDIAGLVIALGTATWGTLIYALRAD
jgi:hypothetical protein